MQNVHITNGGLWVMLSFLIFMALFGILVRVWEGRNG